MDADLKCTRLKLLVHISTEVLFQAVAEKPAQDHTWVVSRHKLPGLMQ